MKFSRPRVSETETALLLRTNTVRVRMISDVRGTISRVMSWTAIYPGCLLPDSSSDLPEADGPPLPRLAVLLQMGFTYAPPVTGRAVVSYTALPPLPCGPCASKRQTGKAVHFCCTIPGVTSAGRYPASCPVKPGLSSPGPFRLSGSGRRTLSSVRQRPSVPLTRLLYHKAEGKANAGVSPTEIIIHRSSPLR